MLLSLCQWKNSGCELFEGQQLWSPRKTLESPASHRGCDPLHRKIKLNSKASSLHSVQAVWYNLERKESQPRHHQTLWQIYWISCGTLPPLHVLHEYRQQQQAAIVQRCPNMPKPWFKRFQVGKCWCQVKSEFLLMLLRRSWKRWMKAILLVDYTQDHEYLALAWTQPQWHEEKLKCVQVTRGCHICSCMVFLWYYGIL